MPSSLRRLPSKGGRSHTGRPGAALRRLVDLVSHRSGLALGVMSDAGITLPQVLLLSHVVRQGTASPSELAEAMHASLPAVSQMIDRLVHQGLLARAEDPVDRRRKLLTTTAGARSVMRKLGAARSTEYEFGLGSVSPELLAQMAIVIERVVAELEAVAPVDDQRGLRAPRGAR